MMNDDYTFVPLAQQLINMEDEKNMPAMTTTTTTKTMTTMMMTMGQNSNDNVLLMLLTEDESHLSLLTVPDVNCSAAAAAASQLQAEQPRTSPASTLPLVELSLVWESEQRHPGGSTIQKRVL